MKCLEGGPKGCYVLVATAEGSGKSFKQPPPEFVEAEWVLLIVFSV